MPFGTSIPPSPRVGLADVRSRSRMTEPEQFTAAQKRLLRHFSQCSMSGAPRQGRRVVIDGVAHLDLVCTADADHEHEEARRPGTVLPLEIYVLVRRRDLLDLGEIRHGWVPAVAAAHDECGHRPTRLCRGRCRLSVSTSTSEPWVGREGCSRGDPARRAESRRVGRVLARPSRDTVACGN